MQENGFLYVHTPIITNSDAEGAGEMFQVWHVAYVPVCAHLDRKLCEKRPKLWVAFLRVLVCRGYSQPGVHSRQRCWAKVEEKGKVLHLNPQHLHTEAGMYGENTCKVVLVQEMTLLADAERKEKLQQLSPQQVDRLEPLRYR